MALDVQAGRAVRVLYRYAMNPNPYVLEGEMLVPFGDDAPDAPLAVSQAQVLAFLEDDGANMTSLIGLRYLDPASKTYRNFAPDAVVQLPGDERLPTLELLLVTDLLETDTDVAVASRVNQLRSNDSDAVRAAAAAVGALAAQGSKFREALRAAGAVRRLMQVVARTDDDALLASTLGSVAQLCAKNHKAREEVQADGGLAALVRLLHTSRSTEVLADVCLLLAELSVEAAVREQIGRETIPEVVPLLRSGEPRVQAAAADCIWNVSFESDENKACVLSSGAIPILVELLENSEAEVVEKALCALFNASTLPSNFASLRECGGLVAFFFLMSTAGDEIQRIAARAIDYLASEVSSEALDIQAVLRGLDSQDTAQQQRSAVDIAFFSLQGEEVRKQLALSGAIKRLMNLLKVGSPQSQQQATLALSYLSSGDADVSNSLFNEQGAVSLVIGLLESDNAVMQEYAARLLLNMVSADKKNREAITKAGAIPALLDICRGKSEAVQREAASVLWTLTFKDRPACEAVRSANGVPVLVALLSSPRADLVENVCGTLWNLVQDPAARDDLRTAGAFVPLLQLCDTKSSAMLQWQSTACILDACDSNAANAAMVVSLGGVGRVINLASQSQQQRVVEKALGLLNRLASYESGKEFFTRSGSLDAVFSMLRSPSQQLRDGAQSILQQISEAETSSSGRGLRAVLSSLAIVAVVFVCLFVAFMMVRRFRTLNSTDLR